MAQIRLLHRKPDGEIVFREPTSDHVPVYAILSHTWGHEEVVFRDMETDADRNQTMSKAGWKKVQFCAERAAADGLQYFWVDTCCIDKRNAVELSAAINSMFRWYQDAARCYVYLSDVSKPDPASENDRIWKEDFKTSRWFSRGWTLQELIAPLAVHFFSKEGNMLGTKSSLERDIHEITRVPVHALRRSSLSEFGVGERMSWASRRKTTIDEDQVYCLLGLLEVFISPIYGEGKESAFSRLQRAIQRRPKKGREGLLHDSSGVSSSKDSSTGNEKTKTNEVDGNPQAKSTETPRSRTSSSSETMQASPYGRFRSLASTKPVLDIPTKEIAVLLGRLTESEHGTVAKIISDNCKQAAFDYYCWNRRNWNARITYDVGPSYDGNLFQLSSGQLPQNRDDLSLKDWIRKIQSALSLRTSQVVYKRATRDYGRLDPYGVDNAESILKMTDARGRLDPLEFEASLCHAISWCRVGYGPELHDACELANRLELLWRDFHPRDVFADWILHLDVPEVSKTRRESNEGEYEYERRDVRRETNVDEYAYNPREMRRREPSPIYIREPFRESRSEYVSDDSYELSRGTRSEYRVRR